MVPSREPEMDAQPDRSSARELPPCLIGMEAGVGAHHLSRTCICNDARLTSAKYAKPYREGQKNDFRDPEAIAEAVQRTTT
jgi:transposase